MHDGSTSLLPCGLWTRHGMLWFEHATPSWRRVAQLKSHRFYVTLKLWLLRWSWFSDCYFFLRVSEICNCEFWRQNFHYSLASFQTVFVCVLHLGQSTNKIACLISQFHWNTCMETANRPKISAQKTIFNDCINII